jgi:hypothetical protein
MLPDEPTEFMPAAVALLFSVASLIGTPAAMPIELRQSSKRCCAPLHTAALQLQHSSRRI